LRHAALIPALALLLATLTLLALRPTQPSLLGPRGGLEVLGVDAELSGVEATSIGRSSFNLKVGEYARLESLARELGMTPVALAKKIVLVYLGARRDREPRRKGSRTQREV